MRGDDLGVPNLLDAEQVARALGCGRTYVYDLIARGDLPCVKLGRLVRVPADGLSGFVSDRLRTQRKEHR